MLLLASGICSVGAGSFSYLADDVVTTHGILSTLCLAFFLLGIAVAVLANTEVNGEIHLPRSLAALACLLLLVPHGGIAIGRIVNFQPSLEIMRAAHDADGTKVQVDRGFAVLNGEIGYETLVSLQSVLDREPSSAILLSSEGGLLDAAIEIGRILRERQIDVLVDENCESACVIVALSAERLFVAADARFGFHRASAPASRDSQLGRYIGKMATDDLLSSLRSLRIPDSVLTRAEETPAYEMYYLSGDDLVQLGLARDCAEYWK
ncbi:MAG: hypothetical protein IPM60_03175 [Rhodospirillales bacterium]|nr:hypothetical protein [Rhodospirillales bacterium]